MKRSLPFVFLLIFFASSAGPSHARASEPPSFFVETVITGDHDYPSLTLDAGGVAWICYWERVTTFNGTVWFASRQGGVWQFENVPFQASRPQTAVVVNSRGSPSVGVLESACLDQLYKSGGVWVTDCIGGFGPNASAMALGNNVTLVAAYVWSYHYVGYVSVSQGDTSTWDLDIQYEDMYWFNPPAADIDLAIDANGDPHICVNPIWSDFYYAHRIGGHWPELDPIPYNLTSFSLAVTSTGRPLVAYVDGGKLWITTKDEGLWVTAEVEDVTGFNGVDLVIDNNDVPRLVYCSQSAGVNKVFYAILDGPYGASAVHEVDDGLSASMVIDKDNHPHLVYRTYIVNPPGWDLKYATTAISTPVKNLSWGALKSLLGRE